MALVLELAAGHFARSWREVRGQSLQRLHVGQLVGADRALARMSAFSSGSVHGTYVSDLRVAVDVAGRGEPITHPVRLEVGRF